MDKTLIEEISLIDVLDPSIIEKHRYIIDGIFEVFYDLGRMYCNANTNLAQN